MFDAVSFLREEFLTLQSQRDIIVRPPSWSLQLGSAGDPSASVKGGKGRNGRGDAHDQRTQRNHAQGPRSAKDIEALSAKLRAEHVVRKQSNAKYLQMLQGRQKLPAFQFLQQICDLVNQHRVVVISGETGSGKSTQIPQFVLDHFIEAGKGGQCNISTCA